MSRGPLARPDLDDPYAVDAATVHAFARDGHVAVPGLATAAEVAAYRPAIEAAAAAYNRETRPLAERDTYGRAFRQTANLWRRDEVVRRFVFGRRFAGLAAALLGVEGVRLYHDQALVKEPGGGPTPWHQDQVYWPLDTDRTITMWMPLVDLPPEVGSMTFVSGSHLGGDVGAAEISDGSEAAVAALVRERGLTTATHGALRAGDATFHAGWTLHRAAANPTDRMRPVMTVIYFADGARAGRPTSPYQEFDLRMWLRDVAPGDLAAGPLNPRLA
ncbi:MAG TPA: phytanoyl-CoA dioxygenase family protein [Acidimicrobiales bacterium]|nr:phytanoyl-CoA dioxygenase family protein [Acidimicrobiales bacterium]